MNMIPEHDNRIADTLRSFSLEPAPQVAPHRTGPRYLLISACLFVLAGAVAAAAFSLQPAAEASAPVRTDTHRDNGSLLSQPPAAVHEVTGSGYVIAPKTVAVFAKYEGRITAINVDVGQHVEMGQTIITLEDETASMALKQAEAEKVSARLMVEGRQIELEQVEAIFKRAEALYAKNLLSVQDMEKAVFARNHALNTHAQARQNLVKAEIALQIAQERINQLLIKAPTAGTITRLNAHHGDMVLARSDSIREQQALLTITDTQTLVIDADVAETGISRLQPGLSGEAVLDGLPDQPFAIEIVRVAPVVSLEKGTVTLRLALHQPPAGIRPNMAARIRITQTKGDISR